LSADRPYASAQPEIFVRKYFGEFKEEEESLSSLWTIEIDKLHDKGRFLYSSKNEQVFAGIYGSNMSSY
jgi:hypothetical protein